MNKDITKHEFRFNRYEVQAWAFIEYNHDEKSVDIQFGWMDGKPRISSRPTDALDKWWTNVCSFIPKDYRITILSANDLFETSIPPGDELPLLDRNNKLTPEQVKAFIELDN